MGRKQLPWRSNMGGVNAFRSFGFVSNFRDSLWAQFGFTVAVVCSSRRLSGHGDLSGQSLCKRFHTNLFRPSLRLFWNRR
mmetsp:Transcript_31860/g.71405  ORF Transcript_31860/g.71405 Transcript_31860/m.71405 type:complete len:80 (+) Transcript_31860:4115-4354(+)